MGLGSALYKAAETVPEGIAEHEKAAQRERLLRESGEAFRRAARSEADNRTVDSNLAVAARAWREAAEQAEIAALNQRYRNTPPGQLAADMLKRQRDVNEGMQAAFTNKTPSLITRLETLAGKQEETAKLWIPLKGKLLEAMAQKADDPEYQRKLDQFETIVETTRENMLRAASRLNDLDPAAQEAARGSEAAVYHFWKSIAGFPELLREDLRLQTNVIDMTAAPSTDKIEMPVVRQSGQDEAGDLTRLFIERFTESVPEEDLPGAPAPETRSGREAEGDIDGARPALSAQDREKILKLADQAVSAQESASALLRRNRTGDALKEQKAAYSLLKEIEELLPRDKQQSRQQQPRQSGQQQDNERQEEQEQPDSREQEQQPPPEQQDSPKEHEQQPEERQPEEEDSTPEDIKALLERALQREKEHEAERRRRQRRIPMGPIDKDW
jgi:hypothetical protein